VSPEEEVYALLFQDFCDAYLGLRCSFNLIERFETGLGRNRPIHPKSTRKKESSDDH